MQAAAAFDGLARSARRRTAGAMVILFAVLLATVLLAAGTGAMHIAPQQSLAIMLNKLGLATPWTYSEAQESVLMAIRLPRVLLGLLVGAGLAAAGASLQGLFRNPLADPGLIGVSTGAALAAALSIVLGNALIGLLPSWALGIMLPMAAFLGGLAATFAVYAIARSGGRTDVARMLLGGVALNAIAGAGIGLLIFASTDQQLRDLNFWLLGSLAGATWERLMLAAPFLLLPLILLPRYARALNALLMGERDAVHLGYAVEPIKRRIVFLTALLVGAAVALTGVIGFVGLVVPHIVRLLIGPDHRSLLPASMLLGAALLMMADLLARTVVLPAELPIGIVTSCLGGPFFLWLITRRRAPGSWQ